jgi:hypothetical protein
LIGNTTARSLFAQIVTALCYVPLGGILPGGAAAAGNILAAGACKAVLVVGEALDTAL